MLSRADAGVSTSAAFVGMERGSHGVRLRTPGELAGSGRGALSWEEGCGPSGAGGSAFVCRSLPRPSGRPRRVP